MKRQEPPDRLSVRDVRRASRRELLPIELAALGRVADALIPAVDGHLAGSAVAGFERRAHSAMAILDREFDAIIDTLEALRDVPSAALFEELRGLSFANPRTFYFLSLVVTGIYLYSDEIVAELGYPRPHRNPIDEMQIADELETGILEPVVQRGPRYV